MQNYSNFGEYEEEIPKIHSYLFYNALLSNLLSTRKGKSLPTTQHVGAEREYSYSSTPS
jgi:hypothetical protein